MCNCVSSPCDCEKKELSEAVSESKEIISNMMWKISRIDGKKKQEKLFMSFIQSLAGYDDAVKLATKLLEIQKKFKIKVIEENKTYDDETDVLPDIFEDL